MQQVEVRQVAVIGPSLGPTGVNSDVRRPQNVRYSTGGYLPNDCIYCAADQKRSVLLCAIRRVFLARSYMDNVPSSHTPKL